DPSLTDEQRIRRFFATWRGDSSDTPLQLLMAYIGNVDKAGHEYGPDSPKTLQAVKEADRLLASTYDQCLEMVEQKYGDRTNLVHIVSTGHGMAAIHSLVHLEGLLGNRFTPEMRSLTSGSVWNIFLEYIDDAEAKQLLAEGILE